MLKKKKVYWLWSKVWVFFLCITHELQPRKNSPVILARNFNPGIYPSINSTTIVTYELQLQKFELNFDPGTIMQDL